MDPGSMCHWGFLTRFIQLAHSQLQLIRRLSLMLMEYQLKLAELIINLSM